MTLPATWMNSTAAPEGFGHDLLVGASASIGWADQQISATAPGLLCR